MADEWAIQSVLIKQRYRSPQEARRLAKKIVRDLEDGGRGGYPSIKEVDEGDEYYHVEVRQEWRFSKIRTLTDPDEYGRVKAAQEISKGAGLKVGKLADT